MNTYLERGWKFSWQQKPDYDNIQDSDKISDTDTVFSTMIAF